MQFITYNEVKLCDNKSTEKAEMEVYDFKVPMLYIYMS